MTGFTGQLATGGLVEFATRTYDTASRVWLQDDSFRGTTTRSSSLNRYAYVEGAPESFVDVLGFYRARAAVRAQALAAAQAAYDAALKAYTQLVSNTHMQARLFAREVGQIQAQAAQRAASAAWVVEQAARKVEIARRTAMVNASFEADAKANDKGYWGGFVDTLSIAGHGLVNFGGGAVNALADTVDLVVDVVQTTFNAVSPTCWTKTFCAAIPNIPSVPIYGDPALYKYSQTAGYATTVAVEFVATGGLGMVADGFSATVTAAKALPRLVTELPAVVNDVKSVVKAVVPAVRALVPRLPGLVKTTVTGVADNAASLVKNPGAFLSDLKTGLSNPLTTKGGIFGTAPATTATNTAAANTLEATTGARAGATSAARATSIDAGVVNPLGGTHNCAACAIAGDSTLAGNPASALDLYPGRPIPGGNQLIVDYAGAPWRSVSGQAAIESELLEVGNGARGIVYGTDGEYAHVWNAVVQDGLVNYVDFQGIGPSGPAAFDPWTEFQFVRTN